MSRRFTRHWPVR